MTTAVIPFPRRSLLLALLLLLPLVFPRPALAHEGLDVNEAQGAAAARGAHEVFGKVVLQARVSELRDLLRDVERWPTLFTDTRDIKKKEGGIWAVDFRRFGHAHDFTLERGARHVVLALAQEGHGVAHFEYALEPLDANRTAFVLRLSMDAPPHLTAEEVMAMLNAKVQGDLEDFARAVGGGVGVSVDVPKGGGR